MQSKYYVQFTEIHEMLSKGGFNSEMKLALQYEPLIDQLDFLKTNSDDYRHISSKK